MASSFRYGACQKDGTATVTVIAQNNGENYNTNSATFDIADTPEGITATSQEISGGSSKIAKVVTQADIDSARSRAVSEDGKDKT